MKKTAIAVGLFVLTIIAALYSMNSEAQPRVALGTTFNKSSLTYGEVSYEWRSWEAALGRVGEGRTDQGNQSVVDVYSVSYLVRPAWCVGNFCSYFRLGVARVDTSPLVGSSNYRTGIGIEHRHIAIEYFHISSAGIHSNNTGIDGIALRIYLSPD
ncbi:MAG: hypothetical protein CMN85_10800 [Spongiibacteraceae bacterium]|uniref:hypothetical protein n=1 Tax=uncultured Haliea sp. TaxID=622616 RepID=UPI000C4588C1|nr:hypothetical protein [Spongiibacteraceae bacterium]|tara:strand:+ start:10544 stop:11011 length:468 start_codon:yes stop_codon:yes gene_type:complete